MFERVQNWLKERHQKQDAIEHALDEFRRTHGTVPMGGHILHLNSREVIVRVMYMTDHIPPNRAWYAVSQTGSGIRELAFDDVADFETPWR